MKKIIAIAMFVFSLSVFVSAQATTNFVYLKKSFINQSSSISAYTLFTPTVDGDYTLYIYSEFPTTNVPSGCSGFTGEIDWTDDYYAESRTFPGPNCAAGSPSAPFTIHAIAGNAVSFSTTYVANSKNSPYTVYIEIVGP